MDLHSKGLRSHFGAAVELLERQYAKLECPYSECKDIEELKELVARYAEYYNYERRMWDKGRMTPVEYEQYLLAMNEAEFSLYIAKEEEKYQQMKEKAVQRAIERAKNLGV